MINKLYFTLLSAVLLIMLLGCNSEKEEGLNDFNIENSDSSEQVNPFNRDFHQFLLDYMHEVDTGFIDKVQLYYSLFFFKEDSNTYFTIWTFNLLPNSDFFEEEAQSCEHCMYILKSLYERNVVLIFDPEIDYSYVFNVSSDCIELAKLESENKQGGDYYDGDIYMRTYKIIDNEGRLKFKLLDNIVSPYRE